MPHPRYVFAILYELARVYNTLSPGGRPFPPAFFQYAPAPFLNAPNEFTGDGYKKLTSMLRDHGVKIMVVDSDGYNWKPIPLFIQGGVTGMGRWRLRQE